MKAFDLINELVGRTKDPDKGESASSKEEPSANDVLVIEDDELTGKMIERLLNREFNVEVASFTNGIEGWEYAEKHKPGLIILDLMLPGMNGFEILKKIRKDSAMKNSKVVLVTAKSRSEDIETGFDLSADEYITKPFNPKEFTARIKKC